MAASLADVVDALTMDDQCRTYYDRQTEEVTWVFKDELAAAENLHEDADLDEAASLTTSGEKPSSSSLC
jgi:formiminotetrahydrofolate cyclodeaminase